MNWSRKYSTSVTLKSVIILLLLSLLLQVPAFAHEEKKDISVRLIAGPAYELIGSVPEIENANALSVLQTFASQKKISVQTKDTAYGPYVVQVDSLAEKVNTATSGWSFWVNGQEAQVGADQTKVKAGDDVVWSISDWGVTLFPKMTYSLSNEQVVAKQVEQNQPFVVTISASQTSYDENWNPSTKIIPIANATVEFFQAGSRSMLKTNENGQVQLVITNQQPFGIRTVQFDTKTKIPTLIPSNTDWFTVKPSINTFSDVSKTLWSYPCIQFVTSKGFLPGKTNEQFAPNDKIKWNEVVQALGLFKGYSSTSNWLDIALQKNWIGSSAVDSFKQEITREQMGVLIAKILDSNLAVPAQKTLIYSSWKDLKQISTAAQIQAAIQKVAALGIMNGYNDGNFRPKRTLTRAEFAHILMILDQLGQGHQH